MHEEVTLNGRYQLLERVGSGGMATVYKAQDKALGRIVAVKVLHQSFTNDEGFLERFQREAHAAANLTHPNIVTVHDIGQDEHNHYIVMEYVDGRTLKQLVRSYGERDRFMPVSRAIDLVIQVCNGIGYAHRANLVHCDVKPQNVLVTMDDRVKVADFGIARALSQVSQADRMDSQVWGTPQYFAPEQAAGQPTTPATDVYAIGVLLFELLGGRTPFQADSASEMAYKHLHETPPRLATLNPAVPLRLEQIVNKVLSKEPAGRYRTAGQLGRILSTYRQQSQANTGPVSAVASNRPAPAPITEQPTQIFQRPATVKRPAPARPAKGGQEASPGSAVTTVHVRARSNAQPPAADWVSIVLGIVAVIALLGLMPLWYLVYRAWAG
jgi:serine/threonine protein kinase